MKGSAATALVALLLVCGAAQAAEWVLLAQSAGDARKLFADISNIRIAGDIRQVWFKSVEAPHKTKFETGQQIIYRLEYWTFNCKDEIATPAVQIEKVLGNYLASDLTASGSNAT